MKKFTSTCSMDINYAKERDSKRSTKYRLWRRTTEILSALEEFAPKPVKDIIDLGAADGRMLHMIHRKYPQARCVGVEYNQDLVDFGKTKFSNLELIQGDILSLDFPDDSFDVAIATAVIEHLPDPGKATREARRVLKRGGIFVLTSPDPFWEYLATKVGHLKDGQHNKVMNLSQLSNLIKQNGFVVLKTQKFMLSPVGMPFEFLVEKWIRKFNFNFILANQLIIGRCRDITFYPVINTKENRS